MQYQVLSLKLLSRVLMLPKMGLSNTFFYWLSTKFHAIGYRQDLRKFKIYLFTKYFIKLGAVLCVFVYFGSRGIIWNYFRFSILTFGIKRHRKDASLSVSSCN